MPRQKGSMVLRRRLAAELRRIREDRDLTALEVGKEVGWSEAKVSRIETANVGITTNDLAKMLDFYKLPDEARERLENLHAQARKPGWWRKYADVLPDWFSDYVGMEGDARVIRTYEVQGVPGLLQTSDYARAIFQAGPIQEIPEEMDRKVRLRLARQAVLTSDKPPELRVVLDEAVLRRAMGGPETMRAQLNHLLEMTKLRNVEIYVLPFAVGVHPGINGSFAILEFSPDDPRLVYVDTLAGAVYPDKPREIGLYGMAFEQLCGAALNLPDSERLIRSVGKEYARQ